MKSNYRLFFSLSFLLICFVSISAQTYRGTVRGTVYDPNRAVIPGTQVTVTNKETNETRTVLSGADGEYSISSLRAGLYVLSATSGGFQKYTQNIQVSVNQELRVDVDMTIGAELADTFGVTINGAPDLKQDTGSLGTVIDNTQVKGLPLDGRNFYELTLLVPGAVPAAPGSAGSVRGDFSFSVNGAREDANNFLLDGVYNVDPKLNTFGVRPSVDAIREFEMLTSTYDASFGRNPGAQVNVILNSGSNELHGSGFEFFRNAALDARNFFAPATEPKPKYIRNQFGGSLGGPIKRDRTFFFADYEGTRAREGVTRVSNVPTVQERAGNFSQSLFGVPIDPFTGQPFPNGTIPGFRINSVGQAIAKLYPLPNRNVPLQNFVSSPTQSDDNDSFDVRVDHHWSSRLDLAFRYSFGDRDLFEPFTGPSFSTVPGFGNTVKRRSQNVMAALTFVASPNLVNETRLAFSRVASSVTQQASVLNSQVGLPTISPRTRDLGLSFITITGFSPLGDEGNNPQNSVTNVYQVLDNASWTHGDHLIKFGADLRFTQQNAFRDVESRGRLQFSPFGQITGNALGDLLLGFPLLTSVAHVDNPQHIRTESYNFFINDSFRVRRNLTLIGGLRYEYNSPPVDAADRATIYDVATGTLVPVGTNGVPRSGFTPDKNNFAPRVGFAWTVGSDQATVIRGGYGVYYDQSPLAPAEALYFNSPFFDNNIFFSLPGLPLTLDNPFPSFFPFPLPDSALAIQRDLRTGYMQHWNFNVQRQIGSKSVLEVAYVGSKGTKLLTARDINQPQPSVLPPGLPVVPRPNPRFDDINLLESRANSNYNALQARFEQRLTRGLSALISYTWSKSIDDASNFFTSAGDPNFPQNSYDVGAERGRSNFDVPHRLSASYSYLLPFGKGRKYLADSGFLTTLLTGWETFGIVTLQSGRPFTVALLSEIDNSGTGRSILGFGANDRPNVAGSPDLSNRSPERWFNTAAFVFPAPGTFGDAGRNIVNGPDYQNVNASLVKNTALTERVNLQFRAEFFNLFNHPNLNLPDNFLGSPTFGVISSARDPRHIQFGLKLLF
ncbi:MAG TPA: carboxypeptidase-like regulatory domain-containing protein [Pyrinomonadaceae bacterium]|nr:carboxypeptidase-like regulatory domain-containing protein [Pyrinomonadaceae bacterium]